MELKSLITVKKKSEKRKREIWKIMGLPHASAVYESN